jgi:hypothetical protein
VLSRGLTVEDDALPLSVGLTVVLEVEDDASLSLSDGETVVLEVEEESLPLSVGLTVVLEVEDGASLSDSDGLAVVLETDDVSLLVLAWVVASAELLVALAVVVAVESDEPFAGLDELLGGKTPGLLAPLPAAGQIVITASSPDPAEM